GTTLLTVTSATLTSIQVSPTNPSLPKGTSLPLTATGVFSDGSTQDITSQVTWSSSSAAIAAVSFGGVVSGLSTGSATVSASRSGIAGSTTVTVTAATLSSIEVTPIAPSIAAGTRLAFTATGLYSDGSTQNLTRGVIWSSSNVAVARISNSSGSQG